MKTMKKFLMVLLGAALVLSMAGAVAAANQDGTESQISPTAEVKYTVTQAFTVKIPDAITAGAEGTSQTLEVEVIKNRIENDKYLTVTLSSANEFALKHATATESVIDYTLALTSATGGETIGAITDIDSETMILKQKAGAIGGKTVLTLTMPSEFAANLVTGDYTDTLTFAINPAGTA